MIQRYREVAAEFRVVDLPPLETAYWLIKPPILVRGEAKDAAAWLGERLAEYAHRFAPTTTATPPTWQWSSTPLWSG